MRYKPERSVAIWSISVAISFLASGVEVSGADNGTVPTRKPFLIVYSNPERTANYEFNEMGANFTYIKSKHPVVGQPSPSDEFEIGGGAVTRDCSDIQFRCITFGSEAMAIPRAGLAPNASYFAAGSKLTVVDCLRGTESVCQAALIKVECLYDWRLDQCRTDLAKKTLGLRPLELSFIYNEDYGITSFGFTKFGETAPKTEGELTALATEYILVGDLGLLKE
jgi:hypothetical protein